MNVARSPSNQTPKANFFIPARWHRFHLFARQFDAKGQGLFNAARPGDCGSIATRSSVLCLTKLGKVECLLLGSQSSDQNRRMTAPSPRRKSSFLAACARSAEISAGAQSGMPRRGFGFGHSWAAQHRQGSNIQVAGQIGHSACVALVMVDVDIRIMPMILPRAAKLEVECISRS